MSKKAFQFLSQVPPFSKLSDGDLQKITECIAVMSYPQGFTLSQQGKTTLEHIFIIKQGALELFYKAEEEKILSSGLKSGEISAAYPF